ncbi:MAG: hypothetical protein WCQ00_01200 [bacterium]
MQNLKESKIFKKYLVYTSMLVLSTAIILFFSVLIFEGGNFVINSYKGYRQRELLAFVNGTSEQQGFVYDLENSIFKTIDNIGQYFEGGSEEGTTTEGIDAVISKKIDPELLNQILSNQATSTASTSEIQYVIFSFDGSRSIKMWNETRQFAKEMISKGKPLHFSYFINPIYLITKEVAMKTYQPPRATLGSSLIGYADSEQDVKDRVEQINLAYSEGNEIGSHNVGHFNGVKWTHDEWLQESNSFDSIMANVQKNNPNTVIPAWTFDTTKIAGFRAPELGVNNNLYKVLAEKKYLYDASGMRMPNKYPVKDSNGIWHIGLGIIKMKDAGTSHYVLSMDYNFWMLQSNVKNVAKKGTPLWDKFFKEVTGAYEDYFNKNYNGNHAPVVIGHHFSSWNDGVYWESMKAFAEDVCGKPKVKCVTFKEYVDYLDKSTVK